MNKYFMFFKLGAWQAIKNYKSMIGLSIFLIICLIIFAHLNTVLLRTGSLSDHYLIWYIALNEWVLIAIPDVHIEMEEDLKKGYLAYLLSRPISYLGSKFAQAVGIFIVQFIVLGLVSIGFVFYWTGNVPISLYGLNCAIFLGFLAGIVAILFLMIVGISAFWLSEVSPIYWVWEKFLFMLGGLFLPLAFYPDWIQMIARFTPFASILGNRSALILNFELNQMYWVTGALIGWIIVSFLILRILYFKGIRILNIEGG